MSSGLQIQIERALGAAYTIERELGGGGMSRVFTATEVELGRSVVIKVIAPELAGGVSAERFAREIKLAARLQQANIVPLLSAGAAGDLPYYTMPFVRGESLRASLSRKDGIRVQEAVGILRDVARALAYAHGEGVVHRDIKPENILLSGGTAVVTDFGIAKALSASRTVEAPATVAAGITQLGSSIGTPAYMSPEQAAGDPDTDHRTDIYAWGVIAWELLGGRHPFASRTTPQALLAAHMAEQPEALSNISAVVPPQLSALVARCLEKDPAHRPQSAREVLGALDALGTPGSNATGDALRSAAGPGPSNASRVPLARLAWALGLLAAVAGGAFALRARDANSPLSDTSMPRGAQASDTALSSLAVLPFVNTSGNAQDEYFSDGMTDELAHALSKVPGLRLAGRSSSFAFKGKSVPAPELGKTLGVGAIIEGTVRRSGERLRVTAQLTSTRDGRVLWSDSFERAGTDVFEVQDAFTGAIVGALTSLVGSRTPVAGATAADARGTGDSHAYDLYLRGRFYWAQRGAGPLDTAVALFEQSVQRDPRFARGWAGLAVAHVMRPNFNALVPALPAFRNAESAARKALALDSTVADAYSALAMSRLRQWDLRGAEEAFATARRLEPQNATAHHWSALYYAVVGDTAQADREIGIALSLDPLSATTVNSLAILYIDRRRFAEALEEFRRVAGLSPSFASISTASPRALVWTGQADSALRLMRRRVPVSAIRGRFGGLVLAAAAAGQWDEARRIRATIQRGGDPSILVFDQAMAELVLGDRARAGALFVQSFETEGTIANVIFSLCDPMLDPIRNERAFVAFQERQGLRECPYRSPWPISSSP